MTQLAPFQPRFVESNREKGKEKMENGATLFAPELEWLASLSQEEFSRIFRGSAVKRAKWRGLVRNACVALGNSLAAHRTRDPATRIAAVARTPCCFFRRNHRRARSLGAGTAARVAYLQ